MIRSINFYQAWIRPTNVPTKTHRPNVHASRQSSDEVFQENADSKPLVARIPPITVLAEDTSDSRLAKTSSVYMEPATPQEVYNNVAAITAANNRSSTTKEEQNREKQGQQEDKNSEFEDLVKMRNGGGQMRFITESAGDLKRSHRNQEFRLAIRDGGEGEGGAEPHTADWRLHGTCGILAKELLSS